MKRFCLTLDLKPDQTLIEQYVLLHREGCLEVNRSIRDAGIVDMQIFEWNGRLMMILDTEEEFSFERKAKMDAANPHVQEWEKLMAEFQDVSGEADAGRKWKVMRPIFCLKDLLNGAPDEPNTAS